MILFWSRCPTFSDLRAYVHFSIITIWKMEWLYLITYLTYRYMVSTIEAVHWDLALAVSNDLDPYLKVKSLDLFGGTFFGYEI